MVWEDLSYIGYNNVNLEKLSTITNKCLLFFLVIVNSRARSMLIVWKGSWPLYVGI